MWPSAQSDFVKVAPEAACSKRGLFHVIEQSLCYLDKAGALFRGSTMQREMLLPVPKHSH